jgi:aminoglycoside phosphotransferase (APT) family kinase protein
VISDEATARQLLTEACERVGLDADDARLMRLGSNAVFRLTEPIVVRIARSDAEIAHARRTVAVARWLKSEDYPAVRALPFEQPIIIDGHAATFWEAVSPVGNEWTSVAEIAELLVRLHRLAPPRDLRLPDVAPFAKAVDRITSNTWLTPDKRRVMTDKLAELQDRYTNLDWALSVGVIHGDAAIGNALRDWDGQPVMIDLDNFAIGHREWDLILAAVYYDSFGWHSKDEYDEFARAYGFDIMKWSGYSTLKEISEFLMVTWVITKAEESQQVADEASKRIESLREGTSRKNWAPLLRVNCGGSRRDPPQTRIRSALVELHSQGVVAHVHEMLMKFAEITHAPSRPDLFTRRERLKRGRARLIYVACREV